MSDTDHDHDKTEPTTAAPAPMRLEVDDVVTYAGLFGRKVTTHLRLYVGANLATRPVVVATELPDNPGASIMNTVEQLATALWPAYLHEYPDANFILILHFAHGGPQPEGRQPNLLDYEDFTRVELELSDHRDERSRRWFHKPQWHHITRQQVEALIGQPFPILRDD